MKKFVRIERVGQTFDTRKGAFVALRDIDLTVEQGEFITLIGHSGCGKSTLLNLIAGLTRPTSGVLLCAEREITGPGPDRAVVFQNHSLLPWLTCFQNVHLAVERVFGATEKRAQLAERTRAALDLVGLLPAQNKLPREISGGMKQRVGIARALAIEPGVLLTDRIVMLTNGPAATIGEILPVPLPRPRDRVRLANDPTYLACRAGVVDFLHRRHGNPERSQTAVQANAALAVVAAPLQEAGAAAARAAA